MKKMLMMKKMKRKDLELDEFSDDFSDFSLSAPARKIRRLDAELPPIMEEEEAIIEDLELSPNNEEMAIVLFKPVNVPFVQHSPSNLSFSVDSELISGFKKDQFLQKRQSDPINSADEEEASNAATRGCLAVVPWVPSQLPPMPATQMEAPEASELEAEETGATTMDIEEDYNNAGIGQVHPSVNVCGEMPGSEGLHQWQQQHCMMPQFPQNTSTPITWFR